jgi:hypothetical protein
MNKVKDIDPKKLKTEFKYSDKWTDVIKEINVLKEKYPLPKTWMDRIKYNILMSSVNAMIHQHEKNIESLKSDYSRRHLKNVVKSSMDLMAKRNNLDIEGWRRVWKDNKHPGQTFMVNMELRNGTHTHFMVLLSQKYYDYEEGRYIIDDIYKYYDSSWKLYCLDYHQDCCLPLKRKFDLKEIQKVVMQDGDIDTETSIDPKSLKIFMESDIIQKVMKGAEMENWIRFIKMMLIVLVVEVSILLLILLKVAFT